MTPTQRTLRWCRSDGWHVDVVERTIPHSFIKKDLFGCIDVLAIHPHAIVGIQCTSARTVAARIKKIPETCAGPISAWLLHAELQVWGWREYPTRVDRKKWRPRIETITVDMLR